MPFKRAITTIVMLWLAAAEQFANAAVSAEEVARLESELTPFGAERACNKEGTIPAWDGGYAKVPPTYRSGQPRPYPFAGEKPRLTITAQNINQYADQLSDGQKAKLERFPTYRLDVYPTHRTAAAPQWVYDNTFKNATRARTTPYGLALEGAQGSIPFPIPQNGTEAMWNHLLPWRGQTLLFDLSGYVVAGSRKPVLASGGHALPILAPEVPALTSFPYAVYDLLRGAYAAAGQFHAQQRQYQSPMRQPEEYFSPAALVTEGIR